MQICTLLALVACGASTMPVDDAGTMTDAQTMPDVSDAATTAPDAEAGTLDADAGCWRCVAAGYVDTCTMTVATDALSCLHCGIFCTSADASTTD